MPDSDPAPARPGALFRQCPFCDWFQVEEPPLEIRFEHGDDGGTRVAVTRFGWDLVIVEHLHDVHPEQYALIFSESPLHDALAQVAAEARDLLKRALDAQVARLSDVVSYREGAFRVSDRREHPC